MSAQGSFSGRRAYLVLDLPEPVASRVQDLRRRYSPLRAQYPAEITVAGSGGVGPLAADEDGSHVRDALAAVAAETPPIRTAFADVRRFDGTNVVYLAPVDPSPFEALHGRLADSGIRFDPVPHAYVPHCTISGVPLDDDQALAIFQEKIDESFTLRTLSVCSEPLPIHLHERLILGTGAPAGHDTPGGGSPPAAKS